MTGRRRGRARGRERRPERGSGSDARGPSIPSRWRPIIETEGAWIAGVLAGTPPQQRVARADKFLRLAQAVLEASGYGSVGDAIIASLGRTIAKKLAVIEAAGGWREGCA